MSCNRSAVSMCEFDGQTVCAWPVSLQDLFEHSPFVFCELAVSCILWACCELYSVSSPLDHYQMEILGERLERLGYAVIKDDRTYAGNCFYSAAGHQLAMSINDLKELIFHDLMEHRFDVSMATLYFFYFCINNLIWLIFYCIWAWKTMYCMCLVVPTCDLVTMWRVVN